MAVTSNQEIKATDITSLGFFPAGTIMMYDADGWQDNVTLQGWYKCAGQEVIIDGQTIEMLDLRDRFVYGDNSSGEGQTLGHKRTLTAATLPRHTHTKNFTASTETPAAHTHTINLSGVSNRAFRQSGNRIMDTDTGGYTGQDISTLSGGSHIHTCTNITVEPKGGGAEFEIKPACYKLIFIKKMI
jgi:microcystin-dependent protein